MNSKFWEMLNNEIEELSLSTGLSVNDIRKLLLTIIQKELEKEIKEN